MVVEIQAKRFCIYLGQKFGNIGMLNEVKINTKAFLYKYSLINFLNIKPCAKITFSRAFTMSITKNK